MKEKDLCVSAIKEGTVLDHITAGNGLKIIHILSLIPQGKTITIGMNLKSPSQGLKDLIKIENTYFHPEDLDRIAIFAPLATVNKIENYAVVKKHSIQMPTLIKNVLKCPNPHCITHKEVISTLFSTEDTLENILLHCHFCEKIFLQKEIISD